MITADVEDRRDAEELRRVREEAEAAGDSIERLSRAVALFLANADDAKQMQGGS